MLNGWEGIYQVSNTGKVKRLFKAVASRELKGKIRKDGYKEIILNAPTKKRVFRCVHRLVAETFIPNQKFLPCVNHKDENKLNNKISNLEWCTQKYNIEHSCKLHPSRISENNTNNPKRSKKVLCVETRKIYPSTKEAFRQTGISYGNIGNACRKARIKDPRGGYYTVHTAGGYHWEYVDESEVKTSL